MLIVELTSNFEPSENSSGFHCKKATFRHDSFSLINILVVQLNRAVLEALFRTGNCYLFF